MDIFKYFALLLTVALLVYFIYIYHSKSDRERKDPGSKKSFSPEVTTTRLRAYERLTLLLERINPNNLLINKPEAQQTCLALQNRLLSDIRREFEHNASQQIYVSELLWEDLNEARENLIQLINGCASQCKPEEPAMKLATLILEMYNTPEETAISVALANLKIEAQALF